MGGVLQGANGRRRGEGLLSQSVEISFGPILRPAGLDRRRDAYGSGCCAEERGSRLDRSVDCGVRRSDQLGWRLRTCGIARTTGQRSECDREICW